MDICFIIIIIIIIIIKKEGFIYLSKLLIHTESIC